MYKKFYKRYFPRKRYGQHFLTNQVVIDKIISIINPQSSEDIIEIGPGLGALTKPICQKIDHMTVIELDRNLSDRLKSNLFFKKKLTVYQQDVMNTDFNALSSQSGKLLRIFGNLPYNISTPLMFHLFKYNKVILDMHFMFQKEIVNRLIAKENHKDYGRLSIMAQYYCYITTLLEVPSTSFFPKPKVNSAIVCLRPYKIIPNKVKHVYILSCITAQAFNQRRKKIKNSLGKFFTKTQFMDLGIDPSLRAENISVSEYSKLANFFI
ncbi:Ribosomal RNA small subunit methyltransferase A [Candidatus Ecksteinia adelgidicola]|nr:Ribosomal RNA small subunit methyltransferase A [Candidatus Ecksteinia adelgidicola]